MPSKILVVNKVNRIKSGDKIIKKSIQPKTRKLPKKSAKLERKLLKSGNLPKYNAKKD